MKPEKEEGEADATYAAATASAGFAITTAFAGRTGARCHCGGLGRLDVLLDRLSDVF